MGSTRQTKYNRDWENNKETQGWLTADSASIFSAFCKYCGKSFKISGSGICQIRSHAKSTTHVRNANLRLNLGNQRPFQRDAAGNLMLQGGNFILTKEETIMKAKILWALNCCYSDFSVQSNNNNNQLFPAMFSDSEISVNFKMSETKIKYLIQFGIAPYLRDCLIENCSKVPFVFFFDETTTSQVKKQFDAYIQYFSKKEEAIVNGYTHSLYLGHCTSEDLRTHLFEIFNTLKMDVAYLLQISMDGPNVNLSFHKKFEKDLLDNHNKKIINTGTCSFHKMHTAYVKGLEKVDFNYDEFAQDCHFF